MKYKLIYSCGHKGIVSLKGSYASQHEYLDFLEERGLCPECYDEQMTINNPNKLIFNALLLPYKSSYDGSDLYCCFFTGNTFSKKESIKKIGYWWSKIKKDFPKVDGSCWNKTVRSQYLSLEISKASKIGAYIPNKLRKKSNAS